MRPDFQATTVLRCRLCGEELELECYTLDVRPSGRDTYVFEVQLTLASEARLDEHERSHAAT